MQFHRTLSLALILGYCSLAQSQAQVSAQPSVSSDDISVAEGLQLPTYGHVWALDTWKGIRELIRLRPPDTTADDSGFSLKLKRTIEFKGEAAAVRVPDLAPQFFLRGVSGSDNTRPDLPKGRSSTLPSTPRRPKTPILSARSSIAAPNESHTPITPRCYANLCPRRNNKGKKELRVRRLRRQGSRFQKGPAAPTERQILFPENERLKFERFADGIQTV